VLDTTDGLCQLADSFKSDKFIYSTSFEKNTATYLDPKYCIAAGGYYIVYTFINSFCKYINYYAVKPDFVAQKIHTVPLLTCKLYDIVVFNKNSNLLYHSTQPEQITWTEHPDSAGYDALHLTAYNTDFQNNSFTAVRHKQIVLKPANLTR